MRRLTAAFLVGTVVLAAACSGSGTTHSALPAKRTAATSSGTAPFESDATHTPGTLTGFVGAKDDVHDVECARHGTAWGAVGKLTNPTGQPVRYRVYVSFLSGDTTVGLSESDSGTVSPDATESFSASVQVDGTDLRCILRVERADV